MSPASDGNWQHQFMGPAVLLFPVVEPPEFAASGEIGGKLSRVRDLARLLVREAGYMKFKLSFDDDKILKCSYCGGEKYVRVPGRRVYSDETVKEYIFYKCATCTRTGFWTHKRLIKEGTACAIQKEVSRPEKRLDFQTRIH